MDLLLQATTHILLLIVSISRCSFACTPDPSYPIGPWLRPFSFEGLTSKTVRTTTDSDLLRAEFHLYDGNGRLARYADKTIATIDLRTGLVSAGAPKAELSNIPGNLPDPTGGYEFTVSGTNGTLTGKDGRTFSFSLGLLESSELWEEQRPYFFVSQSTNKAYVFYEAEFRECPNCGASVEAMVTILDLDTETFTYGKCTVRIGYIFDEEGRVNNSLVNVYDDIQIAETGAISTCGNQAYFFYNDTAVQKVSFFTGSLLGALANTDGAPEDLTAFSVSQGEEWYFASSTDKFRTVFIRNFTIHEKTVLTEEAVRTVELSVENVCDVVSGSELFPPCNESAGSQQSAVASPNVYYQLLRALLCGIFLYL